MAAAMETAHSFTNRSLSPNLLLLMLLDVIVQRNASFPPLGADPIGSRNL